MTKKYASHQVLQEMADKGYIDFPTVPYRVFGFDLKDKKTKSFIKTVVKDLGEEHREQCAQEQKQQLIALTDAEMKDIPALMQENKIEVIVVDYRGMDAKRFKKYYSLMQKQDISQVAILSEKQSRDPMVIRHYEEISGRKGGGLVQSFDLPANTVLKFINFPLRKFKYVFPILKYDFTNQFVQIADKWGRVHELCWHGDCAEIDLDVVSSHQMEFFKCAECGQKGKKGYRRRKEKPTFDPETECAFYCTSCDVVWKHLKYTYTASQELLAAHQHERDDTFINNDKENERQVSNDKDDTKEKNEKTPKKDKRDQNIDDEDEKSVKKSETKDEKNVDKDMEGSVKKKSKKPGKKQRDKKKIANAVSAAGDKLSTTSQGDQKQAKMTKQVKPKSNNNKGKTNEAKHQPQTTPKSNNNDNNKNKNKNKKKKEKKDGGSKAWCTSGGITLSEFDKDTLKNGHCTTDNVINAIQGLVKVSDGTISSLQDTLRCSGKPKGLEPVTSSGLALQVHHLSDEKHWAMSFAGGWAKDQVYVIDSVNGLAEKSKDMQRQLLLYPSSRFKKPLYPVVQQQTGVTCGQFSCVFLCALALGHVQSLEELSRLRFDEKTLGNTLIDMIEKKDIALLKYSVQPGDEKSEKSDNKDSDTRVSIEAEPSGKISAESTTADNKDSCAEQVSAHPVEPASKKPEKRPRENVSDQEERADRKPAESSKVHDQDSDTEQVSAQAEEQACRTSGNKSHKKNSATPQRTTKDKKQKKSTPSIEESNDKHAGEEGETVKTSKRKHDDDPRRTAKKAKQPCPFVLTRGKRKGKQCLREGCGKHRAELAGTVSALKHESESSSTAPPSSVSLGAPSGPIPSATAPPPAPSEAGNADLSVAAPPSPVENAPKEVESVAL